MPKPSNKLIEAATAIGMDPAGDQDIGYLHAVLAQVGLPRRKLDAERFERTSGGASLVVKAGELWNGRSWELQPMPYGPKPRIMLADVLTYALKNKTRTIPMEQSCRAYLQHRLGFSNQGGARGPLTAFMRQARALSAAEITLGATYGGKAHTVSGRPIRDFAMWTSKDGEQQSLWPAELTLSGDFMDSLREYAVPLDMRAVQGLSGSALSLDIYTWLAHRLRRVPEKGQYVPWMALYKDFGAEYKEVKDFKRTFKTALASVVAVYPDARVEIVKGGLMLRRSLAPIPELRVVNPR